MVNRNPKRLDSNVTVTLLDMEKLEALALIKANANQRKQPRRNCDPPPKDWDRVRAYGGQLAIGEDLDGNVFLLNTEGVGSKEPLHDDPDKEGAFVDFHAERDTEDGGTTGTMFPVCTAELKLKDINEMDVTGTKKLSEFIREFGARLENNFDLWNRTLNSGKRKSMMF